MFGVTAAGDAVCGACEPGHHQQFCFNTALGSPAADPEECPLKVRKQKARLNQLHKNTVLPGTLEFFLEQVLVGSLLKVVCKEPPLCAQCQRPRAPAAHQQHHLSSAPVPLHPQGYKSHSLVPRTLSIALSGHRGTGNLPALGTVAFCKCHQCTLASSSAIPHSSSCPYVGHMPFNPGHLQTSHLFIWSNTSWIFPCIYMDGCCIPASSSYQRFLSKDWKQTDPTKLK